jgi:hypothetical protein
MGRKKISTVQVVDDGLSAQAAEAEAALKPEIPVVATTEEINLEADLTSFVEGLGAENSKVTIYKSDRLNPKPVYMGSVVPSMCSEDFIQREYGEGRYVLRFLNTEGRHLVSKTLYIGPPTMAQIQKLTPTPSMQLDGATQLQLEVMKEQLQANRELMMELIKGRLDGGGGGGLKDLAAIVDLVRGIVAPPSATSLISDMVGVLKQGIELGTNGGKGETTMLDLVGEGLKALPGVFAMLKKAPEPAPPNTMAVQNQPATVDGSADLLRRGITYLKLQVKRGHPVEHYIEAIVLNLDDPNYAVFTDCLDWPFDKFVELDPEIGGALYRGWFEKLFLGLKNELSDRVDSSRHDGDRTDSPGNGAIDK